MEVIMVRLNKNIGLLLSLFLVQVCFTNLGAAAKSPRAAAVKSPRAAAVKSPRYGEIRCLPDRLKDIQDQEIEKKRKAAKEMRDKIAKALAERKQQQEERRDKVKSKFIPRPSRQEDAKVLHIERMRRGQGQAAVKAAHAAEMAKLIAKAEALVTELEAGSEAKEEDIDCISVLSGYIYEDKETSEDSMEDPFSNYWTSEEESNTGQSSSSSSLSSSGSLNESAPQAVDFPDDGKAQKFVQEDPSLFPVHYACYYPETQAIQEDPAQFQVHSRIEDIDLPSLFARAEIAIVIARKLSAELKAEIEQEKRELTATAKF
jgi:hypothetical protein